MDFYDMIFKRKSFHLFVNTDKLEEAELCALREFIGSVRPLDESIKVSTEIVRTREVSCRCGAEYCILFYSEAKGDYLRNMGYIGEQIDLYCASRGIGALWFGIGKPRDMKKDGLDYVIMMAISKMSEDKFRRDVSKVSRKPLCDIWSGDMTEIGEVARYAPSACNSQPWLVESGNGVLNVFRTRKPGGVGIMPAGKVAYFNRIDMGIFLYILEVCLTHGGYEFERTPSEDTSDEIKPKTPVAEYTVKRK